MQFLPNGLSVIIPVQLGNAKSILDTTPKGYLKVPLDSGTVKFLEHHLENQSMLKR